MPMSELPSTDQSKSKSKYDRRAYPYGSDENPWNYSPSSRNSYSGCAAWADIVIGALVEVEQIKIRRSGDPTRLPDRSPQ